MDDFLHNLRSGKLKKLDPSRRQYSDPQYRGNQRRSPMDRRHRDGDITINNGNIAALIELLESMVENQNRIADAIEKRISAEERKASAIEKIAIELKNVFGDSLGISEAETIGNPDDKSLARQESKSKNPAKLEGQMRQDAENLVLELRKEGMSYEKIAINLEAEGYPTLSGKGKWRGQAVQRLYSKIRVPEI